MIEKHDQNGQNNQEKSTLARQHHTTRHQAGFEERIQLRVDENQEFEAWEVRSWVGGTGHWEPEPALNFWVLTVRCEKSKTF